MINAIRNAALCAALALLQACGGGGGTADPGSGGGASPSPADSGTGLIPAAGAAGTVLRQQASVLRPLKAGSRWVYRRLDYTGATTEEVQVQQLAATTAGVVREVDSQDPDAVSEARIDSDGHVRIATSLVLAPGAAPIAIDAPELRSPVRANEQFVIVDKRLAQSGIDSDRDGKADTVDIAIWRNVVGVQSVTLPNNTVPLDAVRVDTTTVLRITPSAGGAAVTTTHRLSTWYADGIGVIREAEAASNGARAWDTDETLLGYDGVTSGYGFVPNAATLDWAFEVPRAILKLTDGVLLSDLGGIRRLDPRGVSLGFYKFAPNNQSADVRALARLGTRNFAVNRYTDAPYGPYRYAIHDISAAGEPTQTSSISFDPFDLSSAVSVNSSDPRFAAFSGGKVLWVVFERAVPGKFPSDPDTSEFVVRRHNGNAWVGGETRLPVTDHLTSGSLSLQPMSDGLSLSWAAFNAASVTTQHSVRVDGDGLVAGHARLVLPSASFGIEPFFTLIGDGDTAWALWNGPGAVSGSASVPHGLRLDAQAAAVGVGGDDASLRAATLAGLDGIATSPPVEQQLSAGNGRWALASRNFGKAYPDDTLDRLWLDYRQLAPGAGAPSTEMTVVARYRIPDRSVVGTPIVFDTHTLLLTPSPLGTTIRATTVWHR